MAIGQTSSVFYFSIGGTGDSDHMKESFKFRTLLPIFFALVLFVPVSSAIPSLKIEPAPHKITENMTVTLRVLLEWPQAEGPYEIKTTEPALEGLLLVGQNQSQETANVVRQTITYELRPAGRGKARILPFEVSYRRADAETWVPLLIPEQNIDVVSAAPAKILLASLWIAVAGAILLGTVLLIKRINANQTAANKVPPQNPKQGIYARAQEAITTFAAPGPKERLAHCVAQLRAVVSTYYDLPTDATSEGSFLALLKKKGLPQAEWAEVSDLFEQLEQMRFSRQDLTAYELNRMQKTLLQYIQGKIIMGNSH